jgi:hypothetical protein
LSLRTSSLVNCEIHAKAASQLAAVAIAAVSVAFCAIFSGCVNSSVQAARDEISAGNYAAAHKDLVAAQRSGKLSARERREVTNDICLTEYNVGAPTYPLAEQARACTAAEERPGSPSIQLLVKIQEAQRVQLTNEIESALASGDAARAGDAIAQYRSVPGSDPEAAAKWSRRLWGMISRDDLASGRKHSRQLAPAISEITREYPKLRTMDETAFRQWIEEKTTISGIRMVSSVEVSKQVLRLWIPSTQMSTAALNLDRFANINDAMVARCHCDGRTNVAAAESGLPAYLVRLDPETRRSEVLILAQP